MLADLDLLLIAVFCTADDLLPERAEERQTNADRRGGRHALRRAGDHGDPVRRALPQRSRASSSRTCSRCCRTGPAI